MLYISLILAALLLGFAYLASRGFSGGLVCFFVCGFLAIVPVCAAFFPLPALLFVLLSLSLLIWRVSGRRRWVFHALAGVSALASFGIIGWGVLREQQELAELRREFPYESMQKRLPTPSVASRPAKLPEGTKLHLNMMEEQLGQRASNREWLLQELHENQVASFVESPGFGVARMEFRPSRSRLAPADERDVIVPQPEARTDAVWSKDNDLPWQPVAKLAIPYDFHDSAVLDFVNPQGFGYVKDRQHVAGFESHRISRIPAPAEHWKVQTVELVGLLLHDEPVTYISDQLPRMDRLREAPTRPLDRFETSALERLRQGEDLVVGSAPGRLRMLGSLRSVKQCVSCHGGQRGDLLGAFSYRLQRTEP